MVDSLCMVLAAFCSAGECQALGSADCVSETLWDGCMCSCNASQDSVLFLQTYSLKQIALPTDVK